MSVRHRDIARTKYGFPSNLRFLNISRSCLLSFQPSTNTVGFAQDPRPARVSLVPVVEIEGGTELPRQHERKYHRRSYSEGRCGAFYNLKRRYLEEC